VSSSAVSAFAVFDDFVALVAFVAFFGSSGCSERVRPSFSARRRMRSACASMIDEE